ncbi:DUF1801 domain-containing protein [Cellulomonas sp. Sa3CUA2]|uniref:DUF1801 domain-containing protein n=1 Tax=Cellulomonas avistercoris TaxID=2762242 RepID=A0ABR8QJ41_9CELL|nr:DUF1801 domain-containing protein [Cellulomonas avistercoris]MBD7920319.1 DUF1801 domain-containing protein [Cellulomonas avistercoris]
MTDASTSTGGTFTDEERAAMRARVDELRTQGRAGGRAADLEAEVLARIAEMADADRVLAERVHAIVLAHAPHLAPRTWYGMPAYAKDGKVLCYFKPAAKFRMRYATLGFEDPAALDEGAMWPTVFALTSVTPEVEAAIAGLVRRAAA